MIKYKGFKGIYLRYYGYDPVTGCYNIHLSNTASSSTSNRIWVSDGIGDDRDIDTEHYDETGKRLCSKWLSIYMEDDVVSYKHRDSDNSGI